MFYKSKKLFKICCLVLSFFILLSFSSCGFYNDMDYEDNSKSVIEGKYAFIFAKLLCKSYDNYGNYKKLSEDLKQYINENEFEQLCYRLTFDDVKESYSEMNCVSYPEAVYKNNVITVSYEYSYESYLDTDGSTLFGTLFIPMKATLEKKGDIFVVKSVEKDYIEC